MNCRRTVVGAAASWLLLTLPAGAQSDLRGAVFSFLEENDLVVDTDRHYTQGIKFAFLHQEGFLPGLFDHCLEGIPQLAFTAQAGRFGYQVGQNIFTPADYSLHQPQPDDRPYAGWLYGGLILQRRGTSGGRWPTLESFELQLGVIGPESLAEQAQTWIHEIRDFPLPQGWDYQLDTEPGFALRYQRSTRFSFSEASARYIDVMPHGGFSLGNVETAARLGSALRVGYNLPDNFGVQSISSLMTNDGGRSPSSPKWSAYLFTDLEGWAVGYTAFLDGNLWHDSASVDKETWVAEWKSGIGLTLNHVELGFSYIVRSPEFTRQQERNAYGSIWMKVSL